MHCCSPMGSRESCWGSSPVLTEEHCCGDDLVDEDPSKVPHDKVRRFETKRSALRLDLKKKSITSHLT